MSNKYPTLYSLAVHKEESVLAMCTIPLEDSFLLPLSVLAYEEFLLLEKGLSLLHLQPGQGDSWSFIWNSTTYTAKKFYKLNFVPLQPPRPYVWLWKTKCDMKIKVFNWLLFSDRLNTRDMLDKRHCAKENDDLTCVLCNGGHRETRLHLFFTCSFSVRCWQHLGINWSHHMEFFQMIILARLNFARKGFLEINTTRQSPGSFPGQKKKVACAFTWACIVRCV